MEPHRSDGSRQNQDHPHAVVREHTNVRCLVQRHDFRFRTSAEPCRRRVSLWFMIQPHLCEKKSTSNDFNCLEYISIYSGACIFLLITVDKKCDQFSSSQRLLQNPSIETNLHSTQFMEIQFQPSIFRPKISRFLSSADPGDAVFVVAVHVTCCRPEWLQLSRLFPHVFGHGNARNPKVSASQANLTCRNAVH